LLPDNPEAGAIGPPVDDRTAAAARRSDGRASLALISPHLDDGVFSCGDALAAHPGSVVVTVFAGWPTDGERLTDWDARCGFANAHEAVRARRAEDRAALALLDAQPHWLGFCDSQYGNTPSCDAIARALAAAIETLSPALVLYPLGLFHSDHRLVHDACRVAFADRDPARTLVYEDALYRAIPGLLQERLVALAGDGLLATPARSLARGGGAGQKAQAVDRYASQLRAFGPDGYGDTREPERCWRLVSEASRSSASEGASRAP
jgi:LmbE family N-acetylglucosaminyl deacetylase